MPELIGRTRRRLASGLPRHTKEFRFDGAQVARTILAILGAGTLAFCTAARAQQTTDQQRLNPGQFVQRDQSSSSASSVDFQTDEPFSATYAGADIAVVVNQILGDFLKIDYSIAPDVSGVVTRRVENLQSRLAAIEALRSAIRPLGIAVIDRGDVVAIAVFNPKTGEIARLGDTWSTKFERTGQGKEVRRAETAMQKVTRLPPGYAKPPADRPR